MADQDLRAGRQLGKRLAEMEGRIKRLEAGTRSAQLRHSSIDDGHLDTRDVDGNTRQRIGLQTDGRFASTASNGPPPPVPSAPTLEPDTLGLTVTYDGAFVGASRPSDFAHVRVHVSTTSGVTGPVAATLSEAGQVTISPLSVAPHFVVLTAVSTSGAVSDPSTEVSATPLEVVATDLIDGIVTELKLANDAVTAAKIAADAVGTAEIQDQAVTLSELADGSVDASKILFDARDIGAITVFRQATAPTGDLKVGDLWFDTANDNRVSRWDGTAWVATTLGTQAITAESVTAALIAANTITAQQIAAEGIGADEIAANAVIAGKIAADAVQAGNLAAASVQAGNLAVDSVQAGNIAVDAVTAREIAALSVTADELAANSVIAGKIAAGEITAEKLAAVLVLASRVVAGDPSAARVEMNSTGIKAFNAAGEQTVDIADTGDVTVAGTIQTGVTGNHIVLFPGLEIGEIQFRDPAWTIDGVISAFGDPVVGTRPLIEILSPDAGFGIARIGTESPRDGTEGSLINLGADRVFTTGKVDVSGALTAASLNVGGRTVNGIDFGYFLGTTDANGRLSIPHNLGVKPTTIYAITDWSNASATLAIAEIDATTATTLSIACKDFSGALVTNNATNVHWFALA